MVLPITRPSITVAKQHLIAKGRLQSTTGYKLPIEVGVDDAMRMSAPISNSASAINDSERIACFTYRVKYRASRWSSRPAHDVVVRAGKKLAGMASRAT